LQPLASAHRGGCDAADGLKKATAPMTSGSVCIVKGATEVSEWTTKL
jgi:hypothetical protein